MPPDFGSRKAHGDVPLIPCRHLTKIFSAKNRGPASTRTIFLLWPIWPGRRPFDAFVDPRTVTLRKRSSVGTIVYQQQDSKTKTPTVIFVTAPAGENNTDWRLITKFFKKESGNFAGKTRRKRHDQKSHELNGEKFVIQ
jgi:hypothetical protein